MFNILTFIKKNINTFFILLSLLAIAIVVLALVTVNFSILRQMVMVQQLSTDAFTLKETGELLLDYKMINNTLQKVQFPVGSNGFDEVQSAKKVIGDLLYQYLSSEGSARSQSVFHLRDAIVTLSQILSRILLERMEVFRMLFFLLFMALVLHLGVTMIYLLANEKLRLKEYERKVFIEQANSYRIEERNKLAEKLHDSILQDIAALYMHLDLNGSPDLKESIVTISDNLRFMVNELQPLHLKTVGLLDAFRDFSSQFNTRGLSITIQGQFDNDLLSYEQEYDLYTSLQELIFNVIKHAQATTVSVQFEPFESELKVRVQDNGRGIELPDPLDSYAALGLSLGIIENRMEHYHGAMELHSTGRDGTTIILHMPLL